MYMYIVQQIYGPFLMHHLCAGKNMEKQAQQFNDAVGLTGLIVTKLDGTAKGGAVVGVVDELGLPVKFIGVGETVEDLKPFDAAAFVNAILP
jgi:fused signal recognition particle receptor